MRNNRAQITNRRRESQQKNTEIGIFDGSWTMTMPLSFLHHSASLSHSHSAQQKDLCIRGAQGRSHRFIDLLTQPRLRKEARGTMARGHIFAIPIGSHNPLAGDTVC